VRTFSAARSTSRRGVVGAALLTAGAVLALAEAVALPLAGAGFLGSSLRGDRLALHLPLVLASLAYGGVLSGLLRGWEPASAGQDFVTDATTMRRRTFLGRTLAALGLGSLAASGLSVLLQVRSVSSPQSAASAPGLGSDPLGPTPAVTPVDDFYVVSKNLVSPAVDGSSWRFTIDGLVDTPAAISMADLQAMPSVEAYRTLECISTNIVQGDHLIGNQLWRGVRIADLLERAGVKAEARFVHWEAEDGYTESIPLDTARHPETWIAYAMGDAPLTADHGFPARILIPGRFGMKQPKWVNRMTLAADDIDGYWEQRGWDHEAFVRTMSRIDHPAPGATVPVGQAAPFTGIAFSGDRGIQRVELSTDEGATWLQAEVEDASVPPLGPLTWVRWRAEITLDREAPVRVVVRAVDGQGGVQDGRETSALPSGATGWHAVRVIATVG